MAAAGRRVKLPVGRNLAVCWQQAEHTDTTVRFSPSDQTELSPYQVLRTDGRQFSLYLMKGHLRTVGLLTLIGAATIAGSTLNARAADAISKELDKGNTEPEYFDVPHDHAAMHRAVTEARKTVGEFISALQHPASGQQDFEVKKPFVQGDQVEHIWLSNVRFVGNRFQGQVDNQPRKIRGVKLGQLVSVNPNEISDWLYVENGKLVGGYTVRVHYNELSPEQKQKFDREADFKIASP